MAGDLRITTVARALSRLGSVRLAWAAILVLSVSACSREPASLVISGRVEVENVHVGSRINGRVESIHAQEGDALSTGAVIVRLDARELRAQLSEAVAATSQSRAQLDLLKAGTRPEEVQKQEALVNARRSELELRRKGFRPEEVQEAAAQLLSAKSTLDLAKREFERAQELRRSGTVEQGELDRRRHEYENAIAQHEVAAQRAALYRSGSRPEEVAMAEAELKAAEADLERLRNGARPEEIAAQQAQLDAALANVERLEAQVAETRITAPAQSVVETFDLQPGDLVRAGDPVAVLNLAASPWVRCYVPENRLASVAPGMRVKVAVDSLPGRQLAGVVRRVNSEAEFTPRNIQTQEKRSELVFEVKVDVVEVGEALRSGMYADVTLANP